MINKSGPRYCAPIVGTQIIPAKGFRRSTPITYDHGTDHTATVLIVSDEECVRELCSEVLGEVGYSVKAVEKDAECLSALNENPSHIVLTDFGLSGKVNGYDLIDKIRKIHPRTVGLLMTGGLPCKVDKREDVPLIQKPFSPTSLVEFVDAHLP